MNTYNKLKISSLVVLGLIGCKTLSGKSGQKELNIRPEGTLNVEDIRVIELLPYPNSAPQSQQQQGNGNPASDRLASIPRPKVKPEPVTGPSGKVVDGVLRLRRCPKDAKLKWDQLPESERRADANGVPIYPTSICNQQDPEFAGFDEIDYGLWYQAMLQHINPMGDTANLEKDLVVWRTEAAKRMDVFNTSKAAFEKKVQMSAEEYTRIDAEYQKAYNEMQAEFNNAKTSAPLSQGSNGLKIKVKSPLDDKKAAVEAYEKKLNDLLQGVIADKTANEGELADKNNKDQINGPRKGNGLLGRLLSEAKDAEGRAYKIQAQLELEKNKREAIVDAQRYVESNSPGLVSNLSAAAQGALQGFRNAKKIGLTAEELNNFKNYDFEMQGGAPSNYLSSAETCLAKGMDLPNEREAYYYAMHFKPGSVQNQTKVWLNEHEDSKPNYKERFIRVISSGYVSNGDLSTNAQKSFLYTVPSGDVGEQLGSLFAYAPTGNGRSKVKIAHAASKSASDFATTLCVKRNDGKDADRRKHTIGDIDWKFCSVTGYISTTLNKAEADGRTYDNWTENVRLTKRAVTFAKTSDNYDKIWNWLWHDFDLTERLYSQTLIDVEDDRYVRGYRKAVNSQAISVGYTKYGYNGHNCNSILTPKEGPVEFVFGIRID